ncbi:hypothetical protein BDZ91DRAFT_737219 [Kalaharituber pfeilii]|nr:hypothetical protein BDZ91DRAFT_737219 [Kalaharituber pfeilii]
MLCHSHIPMFHVFFRFKPNGPTTTTTTTTTSSSSFYILFYFILFYFMKWEWE